MPIRHGGMLASRLSTCPRDHFCRGTIAPLRSYPTTWNEYLPMSMSMPMMAIATAGTLALAAVLGMGVLHCDGAPSSGHYRPQSGHEHGRTIPLAAEVAGQHLAVPIPHHADQ
jgi:hypothetical protein